MNADELKAFASQRTFVLPIHMMDGKPRLFISATKKSPGTLHLFLFLNDMIAEQALISLEVASRLKWHRGQVSSANLLNTFDVCEKEDVTHVAIIKALAEGEDCLEKMRIAEVRQLLDAYGPHVLRICDGQRRIEARLPPRKERT